MIPKKIHYIWLGGGEIPADLKGYIGTWDLLKKSGFEIIRWKEADLNLEEAPEAVKMAIRLKKYAFATDYFRLKILYEYGGIYFDTDVEVKKDLSELLDTEVMLGFIYDASIGTAVIGAQKGNALIGEILKLYENATWTYDEKDHSFLLHFAMFPDKILINNNDLFTAYFLKNVPEFQLNGCKQQIEGISIYPKEYFEGYSFDKKHDYTIHHCFGSWRGAAQENSSKQAVKMLLQKMHFLWTLRDKKNRKKKNEELPFFEEYLKATEGR